ncbi:MAG: DNA recombination protein RmuC [Dehalococcoidales bacterium]|nr:DNA recombination protein RmuC [Dehalococcoidales bacterium]
MEIIVIIILSVAIAVLLGVFLRDRSRGRQALEAQGEALSRVVDEKLEGNVRIFGDLREKLGELTQRTRDIQEIGRNISNLQELLRAPKFRGCFGELLLERLLADVLPQGAYSIQHRFLDGRTVDAVVRIGRNLIPVDSKFPLEDFERMVRVETDEERKALRQQFIYTIRKHVDNVSKYILPDEGTFDFALMYIPAENVYYEAVIRGTQSAKWSDIYSYSLKKRVVPVSPNSFYAYLQVIVLGLKGLRFETAAHDILGYIGRLQSDLKDFEQDYEVIGGHIHHAASKYDAASRKLNRFEDKLRLAVENPAEELPGASVDRSVDEAGGQ